MECDETNYPVETRSNGVRIVKSGARVGVLEV
jgi:hypothetical protein